MENKNELSFVQKCSPHAIGFLVCCIGALVLLLGAKAAQSENVSARINVGLDGIGGEINLSKSKDT
ncbi:MAG: hypothetical protein H7235_07250 [Bdellovibrionaceae bacterium]|nr:hypothetical protein [Pseudobdellovibrionaceae bacterium]